MKSRTGGGLTGEWVRWLLAAPALLLCVPAHARQTPSPAPATTTAPQPAPDEAKRVPLDRVVAVVNSDLILESDLEEERRMAAFEPFRTKSTPTREQLIERLIDRDLIMQQFQLQPQSPISDFELDAGLATLRKTIPACAAYHCETEAGWQKFVTDHGMTIEELRSFWRQRMEVLRFIEERFRMGITITQPEIDTFYQQTLVPEFQKLHQTAPPEAKVSSRIREILLQQEVNKLLEDWLKALRAQGTVRILKPEETLP